MLQRNPGPHALVVPSIPAEVMPGETVEWPDLICGFEPAEPAPAADVAAPVDAGKAKPATKTKPAADVAVADAAPKEA